MKMTSLKAVAVAGLSVLLTGTAAAQTQAASTPVGFYTETIRPGFNVVGINLANPVLATGTVTGVNAAVISDTNGNFAALNDANATYFVETSTGTIAEVASVSGTDITLTAAAGLAVGDQFSVRAGKTLEEIFGTSLASGPNAGAADVVYVPTGEAGQFDQYFSSSLQGGAFRNATAAFVPLSKPVAVLFSDALLVERRGADPVDVVVTGSVKTTPTAVSLPTGFYPVTVAAVAGATLQNSGLASSLTAGPNAGAADVVYVPGATPGTFTQYFPSSLENPPAFRNATSAFVPLTGDVDLGSAVLIERRGASTTATFQLPSFYSSL